MSSNIWTPAALLAEAVAVETTAWRVVEAQHRISTMKLADSVGEQAVLESLIDATKPPLPDGCETLHYLLATPFRYARDNPHASRFRPGGSADGVFYASAAPQTAIAEITFYRLLFFAESPGTKLPANPGEYTAFAVQLSARPCIDLTRPPLNAMQVEWSDRQDYAPCHRLARLCREAALQVVCYASVRDPRHRMNYAVFTPRAFAQDRPVAWQSWRIHLRKDGVVAKCEAPEIGLSFSIADFAGDSRLAPLAA